MAKSDPKKSKSQAAKFREAARALEADQSEAVFDAQEDGEGNAAAQRVEISTQEARQVSRASAVAAL
jgi:hypothetical protein